MKIGIIAEGWDDCGVIYNLLSKLAPIESLDDIKFIRPKMDATDGSDAAFSNWNMVRQECIQKIELDKFLYLFPDETKVLVIHVDTAECQDYGIDRPAKTDNLIAYSISLRNLVIAEISNWLGSVDYMVSYAIAIEEIEAWTIALLNNGLRKDSSSINDPKNQFELKLNTYISAKSYNHYRSLKSNKGTFEASVFISGRLTRKKELMAAENSNYSLHLFCEELRNI